MNRHRALVLGTLITLASVVACSGPSVREVTPPGAPGPGLTGALQSLTKAGQSAPPQNYEHLIAAAESLSTQNADHQSLQAVLTTLSPVPLSPVQRARVLILEARMHIKSGQYYWAAQALNELARSAEPLPATVVAKLYDTRSAMQLQQERPLQAVRSLVRRATILVNSEQRLANNARIWRILLSIDARTIEEALGRVNDPVLSEWLNLALLYLENIGDRYALQQTLFQWRTNHANHPAGRVVTAWLHDIQTPRRIALLLPLSSRFGGAAQAFHDGFMALHQNDSDPNKPEVAMYDYGESTNEARDVYKRAVAERADVVVGPLGRDAVAALLRNKLTVPTILLGGANKEPPRGTFEFTIQPEYEAAQVARRAFADGHINAAVLFYNNKRGQRLARAFTSTWKALGGTVLASSAYQRERSNYAQLVQTMFNIKQSKQRREAMAAALSIVHTQYLKYIARRRSDIHFIFLVATPEEGRIIKPLINFHQGHDLPVYATSEIYEGTVQAAQDADLNGILFNDMRWLNASHGLTSALREQLPVRDEYQHGSLERLYALGLDSYHLAFRGGDGGVASVDWPAASANIRMPPTQRAQRTLAWYIFQQGKAVAVGLGDLARPSN